MSYIYTDFPQTVIKYPARRNGTKAIFFTFDFFIFIIEKYRSPESDAKRQIHIFSKKPVENPKI